MLGQGEGIYRRLWASDGGSGRELGPKTVRFKAVLVGTLVLSLGSRTPWNGLTFHGPISLSSRFSRFPRGSSESRTVQACGARTRVLGAHGLQHVLPVAYSLAQSLPLSLTCFVHRVCHIPSCGAPHGETQEVRPEVTEESRWPLLVTPASPLASACM